MRWRRPHDLADEGETEADSGGHATGTEQPAADDEVAEIGRVPERGKMEMHGMTENCVYEQVA